MENNEYTSGNVETDPQGSVESSLPQQGIETSTNPVQNVNYEQELKLRDKEIQLLREQLSLMKAPVESRVEEKKSSANKYLEDIEDDSYVSAAHFKKALNAILKEHETLKKGVVEYVSKQEEAKLRKKYPDFASMKGELERILDQDPDLKEAFLANPNPHLAATIVKAHKKTSNGLNENAQRMVANHKKTGSLSSVGGSPQDHISRIEKMSRAEFLKMAFSENNY